MVGGGVFCRGKVQVVSQMMCCDRPSNKTSLSLPGVVFHSDCLLPSDANLFPSLR